MYNISLNISVYVHNPYYCPLKYKTVVKSIYTSLQLKLLVQNKSRCIIVYNCVQIYKIILLKCCKNDIFVAAKINGCQCGVNLMRDAGQTTQVVDTLHSTAEGHQAMQCKDVPVDYINDGAEPMFKPRQPVMVKHHDIHTFQAKYLPDYRVLHQVNTNTLLLLTPDGKE